MISGDSLIPDIVSAHPGTRRVLDRYGLKGCGGALGPRESVEFFSRVHAVPLDRLLRELEEAKELPVEAAYREEPADLLYRRFFSASLLILLGIGAAAGLAMLLPPLAGAGLPGLDPFWLTQLHANAQVFGWIGLFVMGFAGQGLPRFKYVRLRWIGAAQASLVLMAAGVLLHAGFLHPRGLWVAFAGGVLEAAAALLFAAAMIRTLRDSSVRDPWDPFVLTGLAGLVLSAVLDPVMTGLLFLSADPLPLDLIAPLRHLQLFGFAGMITLGISQRVLPAAFGFRPMSPGASRLSFALYAAGLAAWIGGDLLLLRTRGPAWAALSQGGATLAATAVVFVALSLRTLTAGDGGRSTKFIRAAWAWAIAAAALMAAEPLFLSAFGAGMSVAWRRAFYHAFALGFLSQMILGVSIKVVPVLRGFDPGGLPPLRTAWILLNAGTLLRVAGLALPGLPPGPARILGAAGGSLAFLAFAAWALHLWNLLHRKEQAGPRPAPGEIAAESIVADVVDAHPETLAVFDSFGFAPLKNTFLRNTLGRRVTVRAACSLKGVDLPRFLHALIDATRAPARFDV